MRGGSDNDPNKRLPMEWSFSDSAGITDPPEGYTNIPELTAAVDTQLADETSLLRFYVKAITLRNCYPQLARGDVTQIVTGNESVCAYTTDYDGAAVTVMHNLGKEAVTVTLDEGATLLTSLDAGGVSPALDGTSLTLPAYSTAILGAANSD